DADASRRRRSGGAHRCRRARPRRRRGRRARPRVPGALPGVPQGERMTLKVEGLEPTFRHIDDADMTWQKVRRQRNPDGSEGTALEKWFAFSAEPQYLSLIAECTPGMIVRRHGHFSRPE